MAGPETIGAISSAATPTTQFANPAASAGSQTPEKIGLSDMAQKMLSSIGNLQNDFQSATAPFAQDASGISEATKAGGKAAGDVDPAQMLADQIEQSSQVQEQLTRFVMASSMSSSLGRNLNMFLRGQ